MGSQTNQQNQTETETEQLPCVLVHRSPSIGRHFLINTLAPHFRLLDPHKSSIPIDSFLSLHAPSIRALLIAGLSPVTADTLRRLPSLELVVGTTAGLDHVDLSACRLGGIAVTGAGNAFAEDVADYAVALLIDVLRRLSAGHRFVRSGIWPVKGEFPLGSKLGGKRIGIVGLGHIGSEVAKRLMAFGCNIAYTSRNKKPSVSYPCYENVCDLATESDVLIVCCALTPATHHIINKDVMKALGKDGVIINVGRGALVDEKQLVESLTKGEIGGAGLDVFENEPDVPKELFDLENVVLSPHRAVLTPQSIQSLQQLVLANLKAFFANKPLLSPVQLE
ncbi:hypothetical protein UlMin_002368 [Ulmus minor]